MTYFMTGLLVMLALVAVVGLFNTIKSRQSLKRNFASWYESYEKSLRISKNKMAKELIKHAIEIAASQNVLTNTQKHNIFRAVSNAGYGKAFKAWERNTLNPIRHSLGGETLSNINAVNAGVVMIIFLLHKEDDDFKLASNKALAFINPTRR
ncbi:hypothetical protein [Rouxiella badensis]|jgi:hypothetical protein|uniref:Uncharacterized protein n=1 Tax=Rouxiella badensis TaxID=1646377 RepID=A0A1X0WBN9_9GAMM|nr:hypothetical protein [Rouxiella badensis]MCC3703548.1 hypothetical protein [Rouxiella badensis]MCC3719267.1 hypothetical protein [Rouxiella badensis]MCC3728517.1 hypothetical protein [Rouxiella badensis]MCC3734397.1 hypothetical protein [Rouxiella badensis]MCC3742519.1 hypothetical protein [Rouxiella badensis]